MVEFICLVTKCCIIYETEVGATPQAPFATALSAFPKNCGRAKDTFRIYIHAFTT